MIDSIDNQQTNDRHTDTYIAIIDMNYIEMLDFIDK